MYNHPLADCKLFPISPLELPFDPSYTLLVAIVFSEPAL
jgi:hypothetical protein